MNPLVVIPADVQLIEQQQRHTAESIPIDATARLLGATPLVLPALGRGIDLKALLSRVDGLFVPGGLSNVHPSAYGRAASDEMGPFDRARDATTLPLIRKALELGIPMLLTCRGFQELNVALGGTLRQEPDDLPEEKKHGTPKSARTDDQRYARRQHINVVPDGKLAGILQAKSIWVNSLHSQLIDELAPGLSVEAIAEDGSVEAASVTDATNFALGMIFHPEYWAERDQPSLAILEAFRQAVHAYADGHAKREPANV